MLKEDDLGFPEIAELLKKDISGDIEPIITQVKSLTWGSALRDTEQGTQWQNYLRLEISFVNNQPISGDIWQLELRIEEKYLKKSIFVYRTLVFWIGIIVSFIAVFL